MLDAAVRLFNEKGFQSTSLDDVAGALQVTKPTIYHYFASKDEILFECVRLGLEHIRRAVESASTGSSSGLERLKTLIHEYALVKTRNFGICVSRTTDDQLSSASRLHFRALKREINQLLQNVIVASVADGSVRPVDPRLTAFAVAGALNWIAHWYRPDGGMAPEAIADGMVEMLVSGLAPRA